MQPFQHLSAAVTREELCGVPRSGAMRGFGLGFACGVRESRVDFVDCELGSG